MDKQTVIDGIKTYVNKNFKGDYKAAFGNYSDRRGVSRERLIDLLYYANIGWAVTRGAIADAILEQLDKDGDGYISWDEFNNAITRSVK